MIRLISTSFLVWSFHVYLLAQHSVQRFQAPINTSEYDEICPIMSYQEDYMFFTRSGSPNFDPTLLYDSIDLSQTLDSNAYEERLCSIFEMISGTRPAKAYTSSFNQDVWFTISDHGRLANVQHPGYPINSALPNSICSTSGTSGDYIIVNQFFADGSLRPGFSRVSFDGRGNFTFPTPIYIEKFNNTGGEVNVSLSADRELLFIAMKGADSKGDQDIYLSKRITDSTYSEPMPIEELNTTARESTPFISKDKKSLYFASNRDGGYGKMDIYVAESLEGDYLHWSEPRLLKVPLNSPYDDSHPYVAIDEKTMLFTSNRDGSMDIFRAKVKRDTALERPIEIKIRVLDEEGQPVSCLINWEEAYGYEPAFSGFFRPRDGHYTYTIKDNIPHTFYATRRKEITQKAIIDPQELMDAGIFEFYLDLYFELDGKIIPTGMDRDVAVLSDKVPDAILNESDTEDTLAIEMDSTLENEVVEAYDPDDLDERILHVDASESIVLKNIYFSRGRWDVLPGSIPTLEKLADILLQYPNTIIQIEGHTDNVGNPRALKELSEDRARSIKGFLVRKGVLSQAIRVIGFGASQPLNANETERDRRANRRVEIRIIQSGKV
jgi:OOP family OmpA-OmpF porin